jgi:thermitase
MKPIRWLIVLRLLAISALIWSGLGGKVMLAQELDGFVPGEVMVKLVQSGDLAAITTDYQLDPTPVDQFGTRAIYRLRIIDGMDPQDKAAALSGDGRVLYAEPNFLEQTPEGRQRLSWSKGGSGGEYAGQWAGAKIGLPAAHTITRGAGVTVAVLDTGVDATHPDLAGRLVGGYDFVNMDADPREEGSYPQNLGYGHGTHVAGLVALAAPEAKIMPVRILDPDGVGNLWVLAEALAYAVNPDGDPNTDDGADVINLSLSTKRVTNLLSDIMPDITCPGGDDDDDDEGDGRANHQTDDADEQDDESGCLTFGGQGVVVIAAAGNSASDIPEYPAGENVAGLLAVAATVETDVLANFSNYGSWVQIAAPGDPILSTVPGGGYAVWKGTSMAAPLTAGVAALVRAANPGLKAEEVANHLRTTAAPIDGPVPARLNAAGAMGVAASSPSLLVFLVLVLQTSL